MQCGLRVCLVMAAFFCATAAQARNFGGRVSSYSSFVAAADLDGDQRPDIATAGASRRDAAGYALDITIRLSASHADPITVRTARIADRLFLRDLDGDSDRDLVVESFDREPLAVVLNDGGGHFHQGNLDDFRDLLRRPESRSIDTTTVSPEAPESFATLDSPAAGPPRSGGEPDVVAAPADHTPDGCVVVLRHSATDTRGPPASR